MEELYHLLNLKKKGIENFDEFHRNYLQHNEKLWERYRNGFIKVDELRWKRMWLALLDFKVSDESLAREMGVRFLDLLPTRKILFPYAKEILYYLISKNYKLHLITNGFEKTQHLKLQHAGLTHFFTEVITSEASNSLKPHKEIFEFALAKTNASLKESIMIGDSIEVDIQGALNAGMDQVFVNHLNIQPSIKPTYTVYNLHELKNIF